MLLAAALIVPNCIISAARVENHQHPALSQSCGTCLSRVVGKSVGAATCSYRLVFGYLPAAAMCMSRRARKKRMRATAARRAGGRRRSRTRTARRAAPGSSASLCVLRAMCEDNQQRGGGGQAHSEVQFTRAKLKCITVMGCLC